ncbi:hypothetical protein QR680_002123 [Steinernema hermaphroditum]|uniref:Uncharacterized protein n=1 Tax=Steinernema hermaphroditum TaxID=289476 RepID=A0AA39LHG5_9BILA|nr:hypothetical protein QR680_002123 [Steinernema hermaphroditum]
MLLRFLLLLLVVGVPYGQTKVLFPRTINVAHKRPITASSTCGEVNGQAIREKYCNIAGSSDYVPYDMTSTSMIEDTSSIREFRAKKQTFVQGGQNCGFCDANSTKFSHPAENMVDGTASWWQSPPISRGSQYNFVNITIDLEQEFHISSVWIQMANSPRPAAWVLERSTDFGKTYVPWQYFAENSAECYRRFGLQTMKILEADDEVICTSDSSKIHPFENGEIFFTVLTDRPNELNFTHSPVLQNFARATNVRFRFQQTNTLKGHYMDITDRNDPTLTSRFFYSIKEIYISGRCVCNGHAVSCDIEGPQNTRKYVCRCEHNTCGAQCDQCCPGFEQKKWRRSKEGENFECEPCNCHGHSNECVYDEQLEKNHKSLDIHGRYEGGGRCLNCRHNTKGINCNECTDGFYRPPGKFWNETDVCQPCSCDPSKHNGKCAEETGKCQCLPQFVGENCDQCAPGYYNPPECKPCDCSINGTKDDTCLPVDGQCPCKENYGGMFCDKCAPAFTNWTAGCESCKCDSVGSVNNECNIETGECICKQNFGGKDCSVCADGYFNHPKCEYCDCDPSGTEDGICDKSNGQCLCKPGFSGKRCDMCDVQHYGYPNCKPCKCHAEGSSSLECNSKTGECPCFKNFTSRTCDKCAVGYYNYPDCKPCNCYATGSKGLTCDKDGQCYCKDNFHGKQCNSCKENFFNFPICEECNCNPSGVPANFGGCDKVAPGELCICREHVTGRICDQCKPTYWDLQYHHETGCVDCACNATGTLSGLNTCDVSSGKCPCKQNVGGRTCNVCAEGFYNMQPYNQLGCESCNCDVGGALGIGCDMNSGKCRCRHRIEGQKCDKPIENHYFPSLWQMQYEAEDGRTPEDRGVRFATDNAQFTNFSWRGYVVFSPIQEEILIDASVFKASMYRVLIHHHNPTKVKIDLEVSFVQRDATIDSEQKTTVVLPPTSAPTTVAVNTKGRMFLLNSGQWTLTLKTKQRLFVDYVVLIPREFYEGSLLHERVTEPCLAVGSENTSCVDMLYPPLPHAARADVTDPEQKPIYQINADGNKMPLDNVPIEIIPAIIGPAVAIRAGNDSRTIQMDLEAPEDGEYYLVVEYHNKDKTDFSIPFEVRQQEEIIAQGDIGIHHCPYSTFCRELLTKDGQELPLKLKKGAVIVQFSPEPQHQFGLSAINLVKKGSWSNDYLLQVPICIRSDGNCVNQWYPEAANSIVTEAEVPSNANKTIDAENLPFNVINAKNVKVVALDENQATLDIPGVVPTSGHYKFVVHYYNPDNTPMKISVLLQNDHFYETVLPLSYCPSVTGCRAVLVDKANPDNSQFFVNDKYSLQMYHNASQKGPVYIDSVTTVPYQSFSESMLQPRPVDLSAEFIKHCSEEHFKNDPSTVTDYCRAKIFSLTSEFNRAALPCDCNPQGAKKFCCEEYGGQCQCKENVIGRKCDRCAPGYYNFPHCLKCKCGTNQQCDERTGQCYCPPFVEGQTCDKCVPYAFGFDPLIGCQQCGCHPNGSFGGQLQCDPTNGQCLCGNNVGGRKCDRCLSGFYGFPHCYECACDSKGTTEDVCDSKTASCKCKKNVYGEGCDVCKPGTFDLKASDPDGCSECFCFGVTEQCQSSYLPVVTRSFDEQGWTVHPEESGVVIGGSGQVTFKKAEGQEPKDVYLEPPFTPGADYTSSYGLTISFLVSSDAPKDGSLAKSSSADIRLIAGDTILEHWAYQQPAEPSNIFKVTVELLPEHWLFSNGQPSTRSDLMMALFKLEKIQIKVSYYERPSTALVEQFEMEVAREDASQSFITATSVEVCQCPPPYTGPSCQQCAPGYYRVKSGRFLGSCVPCDCHDHSGTCDSETGICSNCMHNTEGDHCELCKEGFYGNATKRTPHSCLPCECPYGTPTNNFAKSCEVNERGILLSCQCKEGYTSDRCDQCATGYFGEPLRRDGSCEPCFCNNNNDLTRYGACHPQSGYCDLCENNTDGRHCEFCASWYFGDAVEAKNCTECSCNKCGSAECDNANGECQCHPLVEGENCDRCVENAWGFNECLGCRMCECGVASMSSQCDMETGQCECMPGSTGPRCDQCLPGYWNYGPNGCQKCDCESDLSMGTVCDVNTGQCHCQEGATGPRCDMCVAEYLRIPTFGCRYCDECVFSLKDSLDHLDIQTVIANSSIGNISTTAVTGARVKRIDNRMDELKIKFNDVMTSENDFDFAKVTTNVSEVIVEAPALLIRWNRSLEQLNSYYDKMNNIYDETDKLRLDAYDKITVANDAVNELKVLGSSLGKDSELPNREQWTIDAEMILDMMEESGNNTESEKTINQGYANAALREKRIGELKAQIDENNNVLAAGKKNITALTELALDASKKLKDDALQVMQIEKRIGEVKARALSTRWVGFEGDKKEDATASLKKTASNTNSINEWLDEIKKANETIVDHIDHVSQMSSEFEEKFEQGRRMRRGTEESKYSDKAHALEQQATELESVFGSTRQLAQKGVDAARAYDNLRDKLINAKEKTEEALTDASSARDASTGQKTDSRKALEQSAELLRSTSEFRQNEMNKLMTKSKDLEAGASKLEDTKQGFTDTMDGVQKAIKAMEVEDSSSVTSSAEEIVGRCEEISKKMDIASPQIEKLYNDSMDTAGQVVATNQLVQAARLQIEQTSNSTPSVIEKFKALRTESANISSSIESFREKLNDLREKIAVARDMANKIKLGASFGPYSSLEPKLSSRITRAAAFTKVQFFFRTNEQSGLLFFLGNEAGSGNRAVPTNDYIAVEIENAHPKLTMDLGDSPMVIELDERVDDYKWREITVERMGKLATFRVTKPGKEEVAKEEKKQSSGSKSVLNLHQSVSRLFIGGLPDETRVSSAIVHRHYTGDIEDLRINDESLGLWNIVDNGARQVNGAYSRPLMDSEFSDESGISFNGNGYMVHSLGPWNPRKKTIFLLSFLTYSPDGMLFYIGQNRDYMALELIGGHVTLTFDVGSGLEKIESQKSDYNDGKWHTIQVHRNERHAKLEVDGKDHAEGESPGAMFEMAVSDSFYLGGLPSPIQPNFAVEPFNGCLKNLKLESKYVRLSKAIMSKGTQKSCRNRNVRVVSFLSERAVAEFEGIAVGPKVDLTLRYKTHEQKAVIAAITHEDTDVLRILVDDGYIVVESNENDVLKTELSSASDGNWHYLTISRQSGKLRVDIDDLYGNERELGDSGNGEENCTVSFGRQPDSNEFFTGCIGDATLNGELLDFSKASVKEVRRTGCTLSDTIPGLEVSEVTTTKPRSAPVDEDIEEVAGLPTTPLPKVPKANIRAPGSCALQPTPLGERDDSTGIRFGLKPNSRIEVPRPKSFNEMSVFTTEIRPTAANGIIMFATNQKHTDFMTVYLVNGYINFTYSAGNSKVVLTSNRSLLDDEWHTVRVECEGMAGTLYIDDVLEASGKAADGSYSMNLQSSIYIGGLPTTLLPFATRTLPGVKSQFAGCMRNFKLNDKKPEDDLQEFGTVPCDTYLEDGISFGKEGGYVTLLPHLTVGSSFTLEMEIKPRTKNGVLLTVGVLEFLNLQLVNGSLKFSVDNGAGVESVIYIPLADNSLCDGHWHQVKLYKKKNLINLNVNGKSNLHIMRKSAKLETNTNDPLYLGGFPKGVKPKGLDTTKPFIGCVRILNISKMSRKRKNVINVAELSAFGDVNKKACPVN